MPKRRAGPPTETMSFCVDVDQARRLRALKQGTGLSLSDMAREAFSVYLAKRFSLPADTSETSKSA